MSEVTDKTFVVLYSRAQNQFHIERLGYHLKHNRQIFSVGGHTDFCLVALAENIEKANETVDFLRVRFNSGIRKLEARRNKVLA